MTRRLFSFAGMTALTLTLGMSAGQADAQPRPLGPTVVPARPTGPTVVPARPTGPTVVPVRPGLPPVVRPRTPGDLDRLAHQLQDQARQLAREVRLHYSRPFAARTPLFQAVADVEHEAEHLVETIHHNGSALHLRGDLRRLSQLLDRVDDLLHRADRFTGAGSHAHGHAYRELDQTRRLARRMELALRPVPFPYR